MKLTVAASVGEAASASRLESRPGGAPASRFALDVAVPPVPAFPPELALWPEVIVPPWPPAPPELPVWLGVAVPPLPAFPPELGVWLEAVVPPAPTLPPELAIWLEIVVPRAPVVPPELPAPVELWELPVSLRIPPGPEGRSSIHPANNPTNMAASRPRRNC